MSIDINTRITCTIVLTILSSYASMTNSQLTPRPSDGLWCDNSTQYNPDGGSVLRTENADVLGVLAARFNYTITFTRTRGTRIECHPSSNHVQILEAVLNESGWFECTQDDGGEATYWLRSLNADAGGREAHLGVVIGRTYVPHIPSPPTPAPTAPRPSDGLWCDNSTQYNPDGGSVLRTENADVLGEIGRASCRESV